MFCRLLTLDPGYLDATATEAKTAGPRLVAPCSLRLEWRFKSITPLPNQPSATSWCPLTHSLPASAGHTSPQYSARFHKRRPVARCAHSRSTPSPWGPGALWSHHRIFQPVKKQQIESRGSECRSAFGTLTYFVIKRNQCHPSPRRLLQQGG